LASVVGVPTMQPVPLAGTLESDIPQLDWQRSLRQLLDSSPLLKAQETLIREAGYDVKLARALAIPNLNVQIVAQHDQVLKYNSVTSLVSLPIPIFNRNQGNIQGAKGLLAQQINEYQRIQLALSDLLAADFQQYLSARSQVERLQKEILPLTKENLDLTTKAYKAGQLDFARVLSARQSYFETHMAYIDALTSLHTSANTIEGLELTGGLNPTEIGAALQAAPGAGGTATSRNVLLQQLQAESRATRVLPGAVQGAAK
jgi:outer membrane protein, heavy metal efflux system